MDAGLLTSPLEIGVRRASWQSPERRSETADERRPGASGLWPDSSASDCCCLSEETHRRVQNFVERKKILLQALICESRSPVVADGATQRCAQEKSGEICEEQQGSHVVMPPLETFMLVSDIGARRRSYLARVQPGDLVCGSVATVTEAGLMISLLCCDGSRLRLDVADLKIVAFCAARELPRYYSHESPLEAFSVKDKARAVVTMADPETGKMQLSMLGRTYLALGQCCASSTAHVPKLGLISDDELPQHYRKQCELSSRGYSEMLASSAPFSNPHSSAHLCDVLGLSHGRKGSISAPTCGGRLYSLLNGLSSLKVPLADCASSLRKEQSRRMALKSVTTGVRYFKEGKYTEAAQCYYKALSIDGDNVEALVARGALFANNESYSKAIDDFEKALLLLPNHPNARSYLVQTLLAYGREFEATGNNDRAKECFVRAQTLDPTSVDAKRCLQQLESKVERDAFTCAMPPPPTAERASGHSASAAGHVLARVPRSSLTEGGGTGDTARALRETASGVEVAPSSNGAARRRSVAELSDGRTVTRRESVTAPVSEDRHRTKRRRSRSSSSDSSGNAKSSASQRLLDGSGKVRQSLEKHRSAAGGRRSGGEAASKGSSRSSSPEPRRKKRRSSQIKQSSKRPRDSSGSDSCSRKSDDHRRHSRKQKRKKHKRKKGRRSSVRSKGSSSSCSSSSRSRSRSSDLPEQQRRDRRPSLGEPRRIEDSPESHRLREGALSTADSQCISKRDTRTVEHPALLRAVSRSSSGLQSWPEKDAEAVRRSSYSGAILPISSAYHDEVRHSRGSCPHDKSESRDVGAEDVSRIGYGSTIVSPSVASTQDSRSAHLSQDCGILPAAVQQKHDQQKHDRTAALMEMELFLQQLKQKKKVAGSAL